MGAQCLKQVRTPCPCSLLALSLVLFFGLSLRRSVLILGDFFITARVVKFTRLNIKKLGCYSSDRSFFFPSARTHEPLQHLQVCRQGLLGVVIAAKHPAIHAVLAGGQMGRGLVVVADVELDVIHAAALE